MRDLVRSFRILWSVYALGTSIDKLARNVSAQMEVGLSHDRRLVRTELNYSENQAALGGIKESGMKYYRFSATLDRRTSSTCRSHDGNVYPIEDASPGDNMPPPHPPCRSTICGSLYGPDKKKTGTRIARNNKGKTYYVPADMEYKEWYNTYVKNLSTNELIGLQIANGITINGLSKHQQERADERKIQLDDIKDALTNPLHIDEVREDPKGKSQRFIGENATVNVNLVTGVIITSWKTGRSKVRKYKRGGKYNE